MIDRWNNIATAVEVISIIVLLAHQGIIRRGYPCFQARELLDRICGRLRTCPRRGTGKPLAFVAIAGTVSLVVFGLASGFLYPKAPRNASEWKNSLVSVGVFFLTPGFTEEVFFRALLLPRCRGELCASCPPSSDDTGIQAQGRETELANLATDCAATDAANAELGILEPPKDLSKGGHAAELASARFTRPPVADQVSCLVIFVVYHLDDIHGWSVFRDWRFLTMAFFVGFACQEALLWSTSLWPGIFLHACWVWAWFTFGFTN